MKSVSSLPLLFDPQFFSSLYQSWIKNDPSLRATQGKVINIFCLIMISINPFLGFFNFWLSYKIYGIISLVTLVILLVNKFNYFAFSRWLFIAGLYALVLLISVSEPNGVLLFLFFLISLGITVLLFSIKEKWTLIALLFGIFIIFEVVQLSDFSLNKHIENEIGLNDTSFIINISCLLLSVALAIYYLISIYERSEKKLLMLVSDLQAKEGKIVLQNERLIKLNSDLLISQESLVKSQYFLNIIIDNLPVMLFVKDAEDLRIIRINKTGENLLQCKEEDLLFKKDTQIFPLEQATLFNQTDRKVLAEGITIETEEYLTSKNNVTHIVNTKKVPIYDARGEALYLLGISEDITQRKKAEEVLNSTLAELQTRNHELDNYVYRVSHDLRAPLCSIQGLVNLAKMEADPGAIKEHLTLIEQSLGKADRFILSILHHSKLLNTDIKPQLISFKELISSCAEEFKLVPGAEKLSINTTLEGKTDFFNDEFRVMLIVRNLLSNAYKFVIPASENPFIKFTIHTCPKEVRITVADNGCGIEAQFLDKIFDMFYRANEKSDGNGLGLYIVKQSIEKMNGTIRVESTINKGTVFHITLPNLGVNS